MARRLGFTLIEMMVVVVIVGVLTAIALPRIDIGRYQVKSAAEAVQLTLIAAQRDALAKQHDIIVSFNPTLRSVTVIWDANGNGLKDGTERSRQLVLPNRVVFGRGAAPARAMGGAPINFTRLAGGFASVIFHRNGAASEGSGIYLTTARATGAGSASYAADSRAIELERGTGRVASFRYDGTAWQRTF